MGAEFGAGDLVRLLEAGAVSERARPAVSEAVEEAVQIAEALGVELDLDALHPEAAERMLGTAGDVTPRHWDRDAGFCDTRQTIGPESLEAQGGGRGGRDPSRAERES